MSAPFQVSVLRSAMLVGRGVVIELLRRRDLYVLLLIMTLFAAGVLAVKVVGIENPATGTFLLNLGMSLAWYCSHVLTLLLAARQMPDEFENRTLYPLLAKPISREAVLWGKWAASAGCGSVVYLALTTLGWLPVPKLEEYQGSMLLQLLALQPVSLGVVAGLAILLSLVAPRGVALVVGGMLLFGGSKLQTLLPAAVGEAARSPVQWLLGYLPDFSKFNLVTRYTDGIGAMDATLFAGIALYGLILIAGALALALAVFRRKPL